MEYQKIINLIDNKIIKAVAKLYDGRIRKVSKTLEPNSSEIVKNENDKEIPKVKYISPEERQKNIDNLDNNIIV